MAFFVVGDQELLKAFLPFEKHSILVCFFLGRLGSRDGLCMIQGN